MEHSVWFYLLVSNWKKSLQLDTLTDREYDALSAKFFIMHVCSLHNLALLCF